ncbi:OsmC family protein [Pseudaestuariivita atlantica]|uniref:Osmotically inducible protein C n=1 Tax=Pseudaestuariivita atlantica TaxID=1317121 RepID=A0A0L1JT50_9RHOB|nr:OsmC family protein [Pseudaestuariivita atlantica]KNG94934.1 osmotically inducible protein C [Pseudaestuariivita atlantica]
MAIRQKTHVTLKLSGRGTGHAQSEIAVRDLIAVIDEPVERGGTNLGPSPTEMAYAALIGCTNVIGNKCAARLGVDIGHLAFEMEVDFDRRGVLLMEEVEVPFTSIRLQVTADGPASQSDLDRVAAETAKYCPISKLYENSGTDVTVTWAKA